MQPARAAGTRSSCCVSTSWRRRRLARCCPSTFCIGCVWRRPPTARDCCPVRRRRQLSCHMMRPQTATPRPGFPSSCLSTRRQSSCSTPRRISGARSHSALAAGTLSACWTRAPCRERCLSPWAVTATATARPRHTAAATMRQQSWLRAAPPPCGQSSLRRLRASRRRAAATSSTVSPAAARRTALGPVRRPRHLRPAQQLGWLPTTRRLAPVLRRKAADTCLAAHPPWAG
mmetsp:Transcript_11946/g.35225  ORF Transcript_11946/g.35225 Transcript_11946/m.35225 type:complete len:231 (-) Transcript_11946:2023-2715(-)